MSSTCPLLAEEADRAAFDRFLAERVAESPGDGSAWRALGRARLKAGDAESAAEALDEAVRLEPLSAAAHFDLGRARLELGRTTEAADSFRMVVELAPETDYAVDAVQFLDDLPTADDSRDGEVVQVGYEIRRFDNSDVVEDILRDEDPEERRYFPVEDYGLWIEVGAFYNTNVSLAPSSRELAPGDRDSFQFVVSPEVEFRVLSTDVWRAGPLFAGDFSINEDNFSRFNLQSVTPGVFVEREFQDGEALVLPRVEYRFTRDAFDGNRFADRHRLVTSVTRLLSGGDTWVGYWSADHTNFADDGVLPEVTSQDGWANAIGVSRDWRFNARHLELLRLGVDLQRADTEGTDFRYNGISFYARGIVPIDCDNELILDGGIGFRDYFAFEFEPSRNEIVYRGGTEFRHHVNECLWISVVFEYDRFDSDNALYSADRIVTGLLVTYVR